MNWIKQNPFYTILGLITVLACAGALFFILQAKSQYDAVSADYDTEARELKRLQSLNPFPEKANESRVEAQLEEYENRANAFIERLQQFNLQTEEITPGEFQQQLLDTVNQITATANQLNTTLPEGFFLGFPEYETSLPQNEATSALLVQMKAIQQVVDLLLQNRVSQINSLDRQRVENVQPKADLADEQRPSSLSKAKKRKALAEEEEEKPELLESEAIERFGFDIVFTSQHSDFENILNQITNLDHFMVIRAVQVQNERLQAPLRGVASAAQQPGAGSGSGGRSPEDDLLSALDEEPAPLESDDTRDPAGEEIDSLNFVFGQEKITVTLHVELLQFHDLSEEEDKRASRDNRRKDT